MAVKTYLEGGSQYGSVGQILLGGIDGLIRREENFGKDGWRICREFSVENF
jgi:hypothetical protein